MTKKSDAAKKIAEAARKAAAAAEVALAAQTEAARKVALAEAHEHAVRVKQHAEDVERQHAFEVAEGDRLAKEEGHSQFWARFKKAVGWE